MLKAKNSKAWVQTGGMGHNYKFKFLYFH